MTLETLGTINFELFYYFEALIIIFIEKVRFPTNTDILSCGNDKIDQKKTDPIQ